MIKCLAIDDEKLALELLEDNIRRIPFLQLVKCCKNATEAIEIMQSEKIDLLFLDIQMPGITGLQLLQSLQHKPMVIFVTAYKQYALDGFNLDVTDYLMKPVPFERFLKAANKALEYYNFSNSKFHGQETPLEYFFVNAEYALVKVISNDISHIEGQKDYIQIHLVNSDKPVVTRMNFRQIENKLPAGKFLRVHKSYIVSLNKITSVRANFITIGTLQIPLSINYKEEFYNTIDPEVEKK